MILVSHPRAGTEFFFDCTPEVTFGRWEIFGRKSDTTSVRKGPVPVLSLAAKSAMIQGSGFERGHKVMLYALLAETKGTETGDQLIQHLKTRDDVVLLRRRNVRAAVISLLVASRNKQNYHGPSFDLNREFTISRDEVVEWNYKMNLVFDEDPLNYRETFWYEDLIDGSVIPKTFKFSRFLSKREQRVSTRFKHLVTNLAEVEGWMDEVSMPGTLDVQPRSSDMFTVVRKDVRKAATVPYFTRQLPHVRQLMTMLGISREETMSEDGLTRTVTVTCPTENEWNAFVTDEFMVTNFMNPQDEYNALNGITTSVESRITT